MTTLSYREITCKKSVQGNAQFISGVQDYDFSLGAPSCWIPSKTFFRIDMSIYRLAGTEQPTQADQVTFADNCAQSLYNNVSFQAGGQDVSSIKTNVPQAGMVKERLTQTGSYLKSIGQSAFMSESEFQKRLNLVASDQPIGTNGNNEYITLENASANLLTYTVGITAATGVVTGNNTNFAARGLKKGSVIYVNDVPYTFITTPTATSGTVLPRPPADVPNTTGAYSIKNNNKTDGKNNVFVMYRPPLGIMDHSQAVGSGNYRFSMNPNSEFRKSCVETRGRNAVPGTDYDIVINDVRLYVATVKMTIPDNITTLNLKEIKVFNQVPNSNNPALQFTIPPSTEAVTVFVQGGDAGFNTLLPATNFKDTGNTQENLVSLQATYSGITKPSVQFVSSFGGTENKMQHRYLQTLEESGLIDAQSAETLLDYINRGPIYHYSYLRDKDDMSTELQLTMNYTSLQANARVFVVAHYRRTVEIVTTNGMVSSVRSLTR